MLTLGAIRRMAAPLGFERVAATDASPTEPTPPGAHPQAQSPSVRAIISSESEVGAASKKVRFSLKPKKVFLFAAESEERIRF